MEDQPQQFTPKIATQAPQQNLSGIPIDPVLAPASQAPRSVYVSPSKEQRLQEAQETLKQCPQEQVSYFLHRSPEKQQGMIPDYARYLTEAGRNAKPIEQPIYEPPIFVPSFPPQTAQTPGLPIRYDHYVEVGKAPARTSPSKLPPGY